MAASTLTAIPVVVVLPARPAAHHVRAHRRRGARVSATPRAVLAVALLAASWRLSSRAADGRAAGVPAADPAAARRVPERGAFDLGPTRASSPSGAEAADVGRLLARTLRPPTGYALPGRRHPEGGGRRGGGARSRPGRPRARRRGLPPARRRPGHDRSAAPGGPLPGRADAAPAPAGGGRVARTCGRAVGRATRDDPRPAPVRLARADARRCPALLRRDDVERLDRRDGRVQAEPPPSPPDGRPGLAASRSARGRASRATAAAAPSAAARAATTRSGSTPGSSRMRADAFVESCPRSTCPATSTRRSPRTEARCRRCAPAPYTGIDVGFSSLCTPKESTYALRRRRRRARSPR